MPFVPYRIFPAYGAISSKAARTRRAAPTRREGSVGIVEREVDAADRQRLAHAASWAPSFVAPAQETAVVHVVTGLMDPAAACAAACGTSPAAAACSEPIPPTPKRAIRTMATTILFDISRR